MPRKKGAKPEPEPQSTALIVRPVSLPQSRGKKRAGRRVPSATRRLVIRLYEKHEGNVLRVCAEAGIHRRTFYRWLESPSKINVKFRKQLGHTRPEEMKLDNAENTISNAVKGGDVIAAIFTLKTKGRRRGWSEKPELPPVDDLLDRVAKAYQDWLKDNSEASDEERMRWLGKFAAGGKVEAAQLAAKVGMQEFTGVH